MAPFSELSGQLTVLWAIVANTWWFWLPPLLFFGGKELWRFYLKARYFAALQWVLLEVKIPREIAKTPEAMEHVFAGLQGMYWEFDPPEIWWEGLQHDYLVFEMVSMAGETRFYVRAPVFYRNTVEAQIYAQYPEAEIAEVPDYFGLLPDAVPNAEWNIFGVEFKLEKDDTYPLRTYRDIASLSAATEEFVKADPFVSLVELLGTLKPGEHIGYHILLRPAQTPKPEAWREKGEQLIAKLIGRKIPPKKSKLEKAFEPLAPLTSGWGEPLRPLFGLEPGGPPLKTNAKEERLSFLPPDIEEQVKAISRNILKPGFETVVRFCYVARKDVFSMSRVSAFIGALKMYNSHSLNAFKLNSKSLSTRTGWAYPNFIKRRKKFYKQRLFWNYYRMRKPFTDIWTLKSERIVLNTEELASIYHYPGLAAKAPLLPRLPARRAEPPAALPVG